MTFFSSISNPLAILFLFLSLLNFYYGLRVAVVIRRRWDEFQKEPLKEWQKNTIDRAAFLLGIPLGVLIHEIGHAIPIVLFGGEIVDFGYGFYWGYVSHIGQYTPEQQWFISLAGTLGSLAYGIAMWLIFRRSELSSYQYFALRILRVHFVYSLLYYPIFTLLTFIGDWRIIYNFGATPTLSGATLVLHLGSLALFWTADRRGMFEMPSFQSELHQVQFEQIKGQAAENPHEPNIQLQLIDAYRRNGMIQVARNKIKLFLEQFPQSASGELLHALIAAQGREQVPNQSFTAARRALELGLNLPLQVAQANLIAGQYSLGVGKIQEAINHFSQGVEAAESAGQIGVTAELYFLRSTAHRRDERYEAAVQDIDEAIRLARQSGKNKSVARYNAEKEILGEHAGKRISSTRSRHF